MWNRQTCLWFVREKKNGKEKRRLDHAQAPLQKINVNRTSLDHLLLSRAGRYRQVSTSLSVLPSPLWLSTPTSPSLSDSKTHRKYFYATRGSGTAPVERDLLLSLCWAGRSENSPRAHLGQTLGRLVWHRNIFCVPLVAGRSPALRYSEHCMKRSATLRRAAFPNTQNRCTVRPGKQRVFNVSRLVRGLLRALPQLVCTFGG